MPHMNHLSMHRILYMLIVIIFIICIFVSYTLAAGSPHSSQSHHKSSLNRPTSEPPVISDCLKNRKWWAFMLSSFGTFIVGVFIILIFRAIAFLVRSTVGSSIVADKSGSASTNGQIHRTRSFKPGVSGELFNVNVASDGQTLKQLSWASEAKDWAGELISGQTTTGRILVVLVFLLSIASLVIYFIDASRIGPSGEGVEVNEHFQCCYLSCSHFRASHERHAEERPSRGSRSCMQQCEGNN